MNNSDNNNIGSSNHNGGGGPCGACKFLRRKCVRGCVFAPYFDSEQGAAHFAAVHKVFGASNASKLLLRIPVHKRLDAVVTLRYEALARVREPVYGCVGHIFTLQQQVVNLQAELAYIQARLSTFQCLPLLPSTPPPQSTQSPAHTSLPSASSLDIATTSKLASNSNNMPMHFDHRQLKVEPEQALPELENLCSPLIDHQELDDDDDDDDGGLQALAREFVSRYFPGVRFKPPSPP